jgi:hypothetical protein
MVEALRPGQGGWVALHANHPRELTDAARAACAPLVDAGVPMVSQTVLLAGVNDDAETLAALMRAFVETRIKPYYLHHGDLRARHRHLRTTLAEGQALMKAIARQPFGPVPADLYPRHPRRPRQGAGRTGLSGEGAVEDDRHCRRWPDGRRNCACLGAGRLHVVLLYDVSPDRIEKGIATINGNLARQVASRQARGPGPQGRHGPHLLGSLPWPTLPVPTS